MHFEILVEEESIVNFFDNIFPLIAIDGHSFDIHPFMGKQDLLKKLPIRLAGYRSISPNGWKILVVVDNHGEDCISLKNQLDEIAQNAGFNPKSYPNTNGDYQVINRIIVEELESWLLGDPRAVMTAYPNVSMNTLKKFKRNDPDEIEKPSETLHNVLRYGGYYRKRNLPKKEVAMNISMEMNPNRNSSKSFSVLKEGVEDSL